MAISIITGLPGGGKSHQAVKYIMVPNYKKGRRILTNIKGINEEELRKYCLLDKSVKEEDLGQIIIIPDNAINKQDFYPYLTEEDNKEIIHDQQSFVKAGDVVIIDEAGQFYMDGLSKEALIFFTMHRHFTNDKNISCELCFLVQDASLLNRKVVKLAKSIYICTKLDFLGFSNSYVLKIYNGGTIKANSLVNTKKEKYDKKMFPIYSSYAKGTGKEINLDKRANILNNWKTYVVVLFILAVPFAIYKTFSILNNSGKKAEKAIEERKQQTGSSTSSNNQNQGSSARQPQSAAFENQSNFRIAGVIDLANKRLVMLEDENKNLRMVQPQLCVGKGLTMTCTIDNKMISYYNRLNNIGAANNENKNNNNNNNANHK